ncbi:MAG TPA: phosphoadenylyl-sulfate reductase [Puia sp.]|nr:phosphoadenylyl-sulfate reductase [Puia sp.]
MDHILQEHISGLLDQLKDKTMTGAIQLLVNQFPNKVTFSTSFSMEDQVITDTILRHDIAASLFTLDTGRLFAETYSVWTSTNEKYAARIQAYYPKSDLLESFVGEKGPNSFYESVENRKACCFIRKVEPLKRALKGQSVWITGLRAEHSGARKELDILEWDESNQIIKFHPLLHWSSEAVKEYIDQYDVPYNILHDKGFVSIGCAPCTRAIKPGEDFRAGRWWWEDNNKKECGLHVTSVSKE